MVKPKETLRECDELYDSKRKVFRQKSVNALLSTYAAALLKPW